MTQEVTAGYEPLPGYRLIDPVGDGGYGEVWRAEAPGGLTKAIKFIFGQESEKRATSELRSLEKIRGLRHPFLLSLERIEAVDGRLLIVTELADESLRDKFNAYRQQGLPGIPRDELIGYLRDAADALDFISARHALQHLDIKPENLLLVAGHVKVADFGLVKNIQQTQASLVGGMTPLYSAPEVFRGSPSRRSDQYSLAILYQEMLTGTMPFAGANAAELTLQHLSDEPDLTPLSQGDRYVVSRALAKDADHRYPSCLEFVNSLRKATDHVGLPAAGPGAEFRQPSVSLHETAPPSGSQTELFGPDDTGSKTEPLLIDLPAGKPIVELPPLEVREQDFRPTPTLILGAGGAAGHVLSHLRRQIAEQFEGASKTPAVQMLLIDTDPKALAELTRQDAVSLGAEETLSLPLHRPQHYRNQSDQLLHWLSRRWLYNIPRSMRTEGLRPLGRLALADHARQACQRIRMALGQAVAQESIAISSQTMGKLFRSGAVRVYVVASISGGTGSGMTLDLGFAVRAILEKMGIADAHLIGVMMHSTGRDPRHNELARVNAYSWLTEFHHFSQRQNSYPGDNSCGLPPHAAEVSPFDETYLVHLGDGLDARDFDAATEVVADYLLLDALTPAQTFFDACRRDGQPGATSTGSDATNLRSFGIYRKVATPTGLQREMNQAVCRRVIAGWQGTDTRHYQRAESSLDHAAVDGHENCTEPVVQGAVNLIRRLQLEPSGMAANARTLIEAQLGSDASTYLSGWISEQGGEIAGDERVHFAALDRLFEGGDAGDAVNWVLGQSLDTIVKPLKEKLRGDVRRWTITRIDDPQERLTGARQAVRWLEQHFQAVDSAVSQLAQSTAIKISELRRANAKSADRTAAGTVGERLSLYFRLRLDLLAYVAAGEIARTILSDLKSTHDEFTTFARELDRLVVTITEEAGGAGGQAAEQAAPADAKPHDFDQRVSELAAAVDRRVQEEFLNQQGGLLETVLLGGRPRVQLSESIVQSSKEAVESALSGADVLSDTLRDGEQGVSGELPLQSGLALAMPTLLQYGGARRVLAVLPREAAEKVDSEQLDQALGTQASRSTGYDKSLILCVEAQQLSLPHIAVELVENRRDCTEFADRVHSRTDIRWSPLVLEPAKTAGGLATNVVAVAPLADPMLQQTQMVSFGNR